MSDLFCRNPEAVSETSALPNLVMGHLVPLAGLQIPFYSGQLVTAFFTHPGDTS